MKIIKHTNPSSIKNAWEKLYNGNKEITSLQSFEVLCESFVNSRFFPRTYNEKLEIFEFIKNDKTIAFLPLLKKGSTYKNLETLDYFDIVYDKDTSDKDLLDALKSLKTLLATPINFDRINENGKLYNLLKNEDISNIVPRECVAIKLPSTYEEYYASLSKSARQNLRTAYNRLNKDLNNPEITLEIIDGKLKKTLIKTLKGLYLKRKKTKNKKPLMGIKCLIQKLFFEPISETCGNLTSSFTSILKINGEIASFMQGVYSKKNDVIIPRLVLNDKFARYSAGMLMINETVKKLIEKGIACLDLAIGNENYKFVMGGEGNFNYRFTYGE